MAQQVEKLSVAFGPAASSDGRVLASQWRGLNRAATFVACLTAPAAFLWMYDQHHARWWMAVLGTILLIAAFRGLVDVVARRVIPWPNLFGAEHALLQEDVVARRRAEYWRGKYRLVAFVFVLFGITWLYQVMVDGNSGFTRIPHLVWHMFDSRIAGALSFTNALQIVILLFANVGILIGPFLLMAIRQIKSYEPGDADWGVKLEHVRGQEEAKNEIQRVINLWQAGDEFKKAGGKPERGLLFLGAPGTGKTMLAKAIATGFNSPFVTVPGSGFAGMFIGMDILAVQYLGYKAKKLSRKWGGQCVVFIDEIDAVGLRRSALSSGRTAAAPSIDHGPLPKSIHELLFFGPNGAITESGDVIVRTHAWAERMFQERGRATAEGQLSGFSRVIHNVVGGMGMMGGMGSGALNQLLVLMDGIDEPPMMRRTFTNRTNAILDALYIVPRRIGKVTLRIPRAKARANNVYFIGACNVSLEALDPALIRPGRMGRHIRFRIPIKKDRLDIFDHYLAKVSHDPSLDSVKSRDELARMTDGYSPAMIEQICSMALTYAHHDMRQQFERSDILEAITTIESGSAINSEYVDHEKRATAIHEAGHAAASHVYNERLESVRLSIKMRGDSGGHHLARSKEERHFTFRDEEFAGLIHTIGAIAAEQVFYGQNSVGVGGDMFSATSRAAIMAGRWSMGPKPLDFGDKFFSQKEEDEAREKVQKRLREIGERLVATASVESSVLNARDKRQVVTELLGSAYYIAYNLMAQNKAGIEKIANVLMEQGEMYGDEVVALLDSANLKPAKIDYFEESTWPRL